MIMIHNNNHYNDDCNNKKYKSSHLIFKTGQLLCVSESLISIKVSKK